MEKEKIAQLVYGIAEHYSEIGKLEDELTGGGREYTVCVLDKQKLYDMAGSIRKSVEFKEWIDREFLGQYFFVVGNTKFYHLEGRKNGQD